MPVHGPHFLLYAEASAEAGNRPGWKFVLQSVGGNNRFTAKDMEPASRTSRLELLAVVRGLEALDQPSRVTLLTPSRYVSRGLRRELGQWRERNWRWERFGQLVPIRDQDLWRRVDRALEFHQVECCNWQSDHPVPAEAAPDSRMLLVRRWTQADQRFRSLAALLGTLRHVVLSPFSAIRRPAFTNNARVHTIASA
jgi:ribonuclease HI